MASLKVFLGLLLVVLIERSQGQIIGDPRYTVHVPGLGDIQGAPFTTIDELKPFITFNGIPYAKYDSYMGENRFKPSEVWEGPLESAINSSWPYLAVNPLIFCPQPGLLSGAIDIPTTKARDFRNILKMPAVQKIPGMNVDLKELEGRTFGQEDCLVININTPALPSEENTELLPVIVFLHGGGSDSFWGSLFNGMRFLQHKVVYVTINYRIGILGSFNLNINDAPGNAGLYDTITALKWIKQNIQYFGGDPESVTLSGQSAGGQIATHLMLSPLVKDQNLFHRVAGFSGSAITVRASLQREDFIPLHLKVARLAGCHNPDDENPDHQVIRDCMAALPHKQLVIATYIMSEEQEYNGEGLEYEVRVPTIQQSPDVTIPKVIEKHPLAVLAAQEQLSVPLLLGGTRHDGSFALANLYKRFIERNDLHLNGTFMKNELVPRLLTLMGVDVDPVFYHALASVFMGDAKNSEDFHSKIPGLIDMTTAYGMKGGSYQIIEEHSKVNEFCYSYSFDYKGMWMLQDLIGDVSVVPGGVGHNDDLLYLFQILPLLRKMDLDVSRRWVDKIVKFAYYGNPNGDVAAGEEEWPRHDPETKPYFVVDKVDYVDYNQRDKWANVAIELFDPTWKYK